ncbi:MAG: Wzz/FepE/Etk N-terminal domain-containing protein [Candidatus Binataceae bacterium]
MNTVDNHLERMPVGMPVHGNGYGHTTQLTESQQATIEMLHYWNLLWVHKWWIGALTIAVALAFGCYTKYESVKWYRARAVITPVAPGQDLESGDLSGGLGQMGGGMGGLTALLGIAGPGDNVVIAQRYIAIMESAQFGVDLVKRYGLVSTLDPAGGHDDTFWRLHELINSRFSSDYDYQSGDLTLYFDDPHPAVAQRILGLYLQSLRDKLRGEVVQTAAAAAHSLEDEVKNTPDALLQTQLYELMARQIQREKLAQVQANFAFKVIEPPVVPDHYFKPIARHNAMLAGLLTLTLLCAFVVLREWFRTARIHLARREAHARASAGEPPFTTIERPAHVEINLHH